MSWGSGFEPLEGLKRQILITNEYDLFEKISSKLEVKAVTWRLSGGRSLLPPSRATAGLDMTNDMCLGSEFVDVMRLYLGANSSLGKIIVW